jgi:hypothetical protein
LTFSVGRVCGRSRHALSESHRRAERSRLLANKHRAGVRAVAVAVVDADPDGIGAITIDGTGVQPCDRVARVRGGARVRAACHIIGSSGQAARDSNTVPSGRSTRATPKGANNQRRCAGGRRNVAGADEHAVGPRRLARRPCSEQPSGPTACLGGEVLAATLVNQSWRSHDFAGPRPNGSRAGEPSWPMRRRRPRRGRVRRAWSRRGGRRRWTRCLRRTRRRPCSAPQAAARGSGA